MRFSAVSKTLHIAGRPVKIHGISTGSVSVKSKFRDATRKGVLAQLDFARDKNFTEWMPIWTWVIEHPDGIWLIDTGENNDVMDKDYFKSSGKFANWLNTTQFKFEVSKEEEIHQQLNKLGIATKNVNNILITHLHLDHIDGIKFFEGNSIFVHELEWKKPYGDLPKLYPSWFQPALLTLEESYESFSKTTDLTNDHKLKLLFTPGHTHGHCSVLLQADEAHVLFAGDLSYNQDQLINNVYSGAIVNHKAAAASYENVRKLSALQPLVYLPSHDKEAGSRLTKLSMLPSIVKNQS